VLHCRINFAWLLTAVVAVSPCSAVSILVNNHSFETPLVTPLGQISAPTGWTLLSNAAVVGAYNPYRFSPDNGFYNGATFATDPNSGGNGAVGISGSMLAFVYQGGVGSGFSQTLADTLQPNTTYTLTVREFQRNGTVYAAPTLGSSIELLAGTTVLASAVNNTGPGAAISLDRVAVLPNSAAFAALYGQALTIRIRTTLPFTVPNQATDWDNVRLTADTAVPEPGTIVLVSAAFAAAALRRLRQRS
jgi:hypothetical protein